MAPFTVVRLGDAALIWADRPLDLAVAPALQDALDALIAQGCTPLVVDLVRVPSIDGGAVTVLAAAASRTGYAGRGLDLRLAGGHRFTVRDGAHLRRAIALVYPTAA